MTNTLLYLLEVSGLGSLVIMIFLIGHSPAIIALIIGLVIRKNHPKKAKRLFIFSGIYFIIGLGICGSIL